MNAFEVAALLLLTVWLATAVLLRDPAEEETSIEEAVEVVQTRTFVIPHQISWAHHHGYRPFGGTYIGARALRGVRFREGDELVIIGPLSREDYEVIDIARQTSSAQPKVTLL